MKIKPLNIQYLFMLLLLSVIIEGCNTKDKLVGEYYLTNEMKQTVPFDGFETVYFIDGEDTIVFDRGERSIFIPTIRISPNEYTYGEYDDTEFNTDDGKYSIMIFLQTTYYNSYPGRGKIIWSGVGKCQFGSAKPNWHFLCALKRYFQLFNQFNLLLFS